LFWFFEYEAVLVDMKKRLSVEHRKHIREAMRGKVRAKNLTGQKFGKWAVLHPAPRRKGNTDAFWECECECGRHGEVSSYRLVRGKSGGCLSCQKRKLPFESAYNTLVSGAKKRGIPVSLTYEEFVKFTETYICHYCEDSIVWVKFGTNNKGATTSNLDRKNNAWGYITGNLVVCCIVCNRVKLNVFTYEEMLELGETIRALREKKGAARA
jgi:hypothetical protein